MNARTWTTWCSATMIAAGASAGETASTSADKTSTPPAINYNLAESRLPAPTFLKSVKPAAKKVESAKPEAPAAAKTVQAETPKAPPPAMKLEASLPVLPIPLATPKAAMVEPAVMKPEAAAPLGPMIAPVGAYLPTVDDHMKCVDCLKALSGSPIEADRKAALAELAKLSAWKQMKTSYMILRRVALTEYNTKMRADAVKLLGESMMEHALAADTLKLSAQYDSDGVIRASALAQLERLASLPPDRVVK